MADTSTISQPPQPSMDQAIAPTYTAPRGSRNPRRGRGAPRNNHDGRSHPPNLPRTVDSGRQFGGQLTRLHADAADFVPGGLVPASVTPPTAGQNQPQQPSKSKRRPPKQQDVPKSTDPSSPTQKPQLRQRRESLIRSKAADIATRTHEDISHGIYECAICTNEISRNSKVWSCRTCWTVFHIGCIKKWSKNEGSAVAQQVRDGEIQAPKQWRCPGCNLPKEALPTNYSCWCEKDVDPKSIPGVPPHSCGQSCGRSREFPKVCPHPCDLVCHAGPCPPCTAIGPVQSCFCGKDSTRRKCVETDYESGWSCGNPCGDLMPCGEHTCPRPCHEGLCGDCEEEVDTRCYCGKIEKLIPCNTREEEKQSNGWTGIFDCHQPCGNTMDCGIHHCEKQCHPQDGATPHCPRSPDMISNCPCGKTALSDLSITPRQLCTDSIPNCRKACGRTLQCGHACPQVCHSGDCLPCLLTVTIACRCQRNTFNTICHQGSGEPPQCFRICKATLNCGRHECGERCCTGERKAAERQATKRKLKPLGAAGRVFDDGIEAEHICTRVCGRTLKCGNHTCQELCHKGPCNSCKEAIFEDISCNCGRTTLQAPLPCGTQQPPCSFPCRTPKICGHPQVAHNCHPDTEPCPSCPFLVEKQCMCGKKVLKNQSCFRTDVHCGLVCGKRLKCGSHTCQKVCHRPGECEDAGTSCHQQCGKPKKICGHPCENQCHAPSACKEDKSCPSKIIITCDCQRRKEEVRCNARAGSAANTARDSSLKCDDECARLLRNAQLAHALNIADDHTDDHVPYSNTTLSLFSTGDPTWSQEQEKLLRIFAADDTERRLRFKPMKPGQRSFVHALAEDFGFDSESVDPEPHRHVVLFKTPKFVSAPMKTLAQAARVRRVQSVAPAPSRVEVADAPKRADEAHPPFNGFLLSRPRFALTVDEVDLHVKKIAGDIGFGIHFLMQRDAIALVATAAQQPKVTDQQLLRLRPLLDTEIQKHHLAESTILCSFDTSTSNTASSSEPPILYEQDPLLPLPSTTSAAVSGWSQVAAKGSASPKHRAPQTRSVGEKPTYTVLGSRLAEYRKRKDEEERLKELKKLGTDKPVEPESWEDEVDDEVAEDQGVSDGNVETHAESKDASEVEAEVDGNVEAKEISEAEGAADTELSRPGSGVLTPLSRE